MPRKIGIIGYGALGQQLAKVCIESPDFELVAIWNRRTDIDNSPCPVYPLTDLANLSTFAKKVDLIIEVAHPNVTHDYVEHILGVADYLIGSPTALALPGSFDKVRSLCAKFNRAVHVPAGAMWGGEDIRRMTDNGSLEGLTMIMRKHPACLKLESPLREVCEKIVEADGEVVLFEGTVADLCPLAPNNVNTMAAAAVAAHNLGFDKVKAKLTADATLASHIVEVHVVGRNRFECRTIRTSPAAVGAVTSDATYKSFAASLIRAHGKGVGIHLC